MDIDDPRRHARNTDPDTSHQAAEDTEEIRRAHRRTALQWFYDNDREQGWTQAEFDAITSEDFCGSCFWKRFSELRQQGFLVRIGSRMGDKGQPQMFCRITKDGCKELEAAILPDLPEPEVTVRPDVATVACAFYETYEELAPEYGYQPREEFSVSWESVPADDKALMIATINRLLEQGVIKIP
jgi:hypothetical protein